MATLSAARRASRPFSRAASFSRHCRQARRRVRNCAEKHAYVHARAYTHACTTPISGSGRCSLTPHSFLTRCDSSTLVDTPLHPARTLFHVHPPAFCPEGTTPGANTHVLSMILQLSRGVSHRRRADELAIFVFEAAVSARVDGDACVCVQSAFRQAPAREMPIVALRMYVFKNRMAEEINEVSSMATESLIASYLSQTHPSFDTLAPHTGASTLAPAKSGAVAPCCSPGKSEGTDPQADPRRSVFHRHFQKPWTRTSCIVQCVSSACINSEHHLLHEDINSKNPEAPPERNA